MNIKYLALFLMLHGAAGASADWRRPEYIVDSFFEIALKNEYTQTGRYVKKWPAAGIRYRYVHRIADKRLHEELVELHLRHLEKITGLPIEPARNDAEAGLIIVFSREDSLKDDLRHFFGIQSVSQRERLFKQSICLGRFSTDSAGTIQKAVAIIPVDRARDRGKLVDCIVEELTQVLGLPNDSEKVFPSVFNDRSVDHLLTGLDYILLKTLYDPRIRPGMGKTEALPLVRAIVADFTRNGSIERADSLVQEGGLYPLLD